MAEVFLKPENYGVFLSFFSLFIYSFGYGLWLVNWS